MTDNHTDHVEANVQKMAELHAKHAGNDPWLQRFIMRVTSTLGRASAAAVLVSLLVTWVVYNGLGPSRGFKAFDPFPFPVLSMAASVVALFTTLLILVTQRREEELARHRAQLTLHLVALSEQKVAKIIELLQEQRRENPLLPTRHDDLAAEMAQAADPDHVLDRIIETYERSDLD